MIQTDKQARELAGKLTKSELLSLMDEKWCWVHIKTFDIIMVKINTLQQKEEETFAAWLAFEMPGPGNDTKGAIKYYTACEEKEKIYKKYNRMQKKIERYYKQIATLRTQ